jgi:hypothetical protein
LGKDTGESKTMLALYTGNKMNKRGQVAKTSSQQNAVEIGSTSKQAHHAYRHRRPFRLLFLTMLFLIGFFVLAGSGGKTTGIPAHAPVQHTSVSASASQPVPEGTTFSGSGEALPRTPTIPAFCAPFDVNCWLGQAAQWIAQNIFNVLQPLVDAVNQSSLNFITQTPPAGTYQNPTVIQFTTWSIGVVNAAVAIFIVIAGYNIMIARQIGAESYELMEFLPRLALAVLAANFSLFFIRLFIDLENALNLDVIHLFSLTILSNTIVGIFHGNLLGAGLLTFVLVIVLGVMDLLVAWQMLLRLALLILLIVLAPLAFLCGALHQTQGYLRLWISTFAATVFIQFVQVSALAIGSTLISYVTAANLFNLGGSLLSIITSAAVLYLVLRIPGMIRVWALRPVAEAGPAALHAAQGTIGSAVGTGLRLMALL